MISPELPELRVPEELEAYAAEVRAAMETPYDLPGDFVEVYALVEATVLRERTLREITIPEVDPRQFGLYGVEDYLGATTSTVLRLTSVDGCGDGEPKVLKVLREPRMRVAGSGGPFWDNWIGHPLFPWSGLDDDNLVLGVALQEDCLRGELRRGVLYNRPFGTSPYLGIVGARQHLVGESGGWVEILPRSEVNVEELIFPALLMEEVPMDFLVSEVFFDWDNGAWPELDEEDMAFLAAQSVLAYDRGSVPAPDGLSRKYGSLEFFRRCMTLETPAQAAKMGEWFGDNEVLVRAGANAGVLVELLGEFLGGWNGDVRSEATKIVIGHADSKFSNTGLIITNRDEFIRAIKDRSGEDLKFVLLDAQSLAVKPHMMYGVGEEEITYAHWAIVPRVQQWAYALMMLEGMGLSRIHRKALRMIVEVTGVEWSEEIERFYWAQMAYKMGGVEPLVNAWNWNSLNGAEPSRMLALTLRDYPERAVEIARKALK